MTDRSGPGRADTKAQLGAHVTVGSLAALCEPGLWPQSARLWNPARYAFRICKALASGERTGPAICRVGFQLDRQPNWVPMFSSDNPLLKRLIQAVVDTGVVPAARK